MASRYFPGFYRQARSIPWTRTGFLLALGGWFCLVISIGLVHNLQETSSAWAGYLGYAGIVLGICLIVFGFRRVSNDPTPETIWNKTVCSATVPILDRVFCDEDDTGAYYIHPRYYDGPYEKRWYLELGMLPCQAKLAPDETRVVAKITEQQYYHYSGRTSLTIYYSPKDPFVFLLEDEV